MMNGPENTTPDATPENGSAVMTANRSRMPNWLRYMLIVLCLLAAVFGIGVAAGFTKAEIEHGFSTKGLAILGLILAAAIVPIWGAWHLYSKRRIDDAPVAPRIKKSRNILLVSVAAGVVIGLFLAANAAADAPFSTFSNGPLPALVAVMAIAGWLFAGPVLSVIWLRNLDEHEARGNNVGAMVALMFYLTITPSWWVGWRGGFWPEPDAMIIFLAVTLVYGAVWAWHRYR